MKWFSRVMIIIHICLLAFGVFSAWYGFDNAMVINQGGYLYDDNGDIIGMWDGWGEADYPDWMFGLWLPVYILTRMPFWWLVAYFGVGLWLFIYYVFPHIMSRSE